jgi:hypothetical protein
MGNGIRYCSAGSRDNQRRARRGSATDTVSRPLTVPHTGYSAGLAASADFDAVPVALSQWELFDLRRSARTLCIRARP